MIFRRAATHTVLLILAGSALAAGGLAAWLFPRAFPVIVLSKRITRDDALQRADSFFRTHDIAPPRSRRAVRFRPDDSLRTFVDLFGGGRDTLDALVRGRDVAIFTWSVRAFVPRDQHEARVHFTPDGRITGFERRFAETDKRPELSADSAQRVAEHVLRAWLGETPARWRLATSSYAIQKSSARVDHTLTFERSDRRVAGAPIRLDIVIAGDAPSLAKPYVVIPESFRRRYGEMRSANELLSLIAAVGILAIVIAGAVALRRFARRRLVRWRAPFIVAAVIAVLLIAAGINELPLAWYDYDTAMSPAIYGMMIVTGALALGLILGLIAAITLAAAEVAARAAFPRHLDWWGLWKYRGTREVAGRIAGGYSLAAISLAYVVVFYLVTRRLFGWWVPAELLDDPNQIATPMPWITGIAVAVQAGVWEEALFRALPLSLLSLWVGSRPRRGLWMTAGVVGTALVFGFGHANYPSWPPYSRGVEIFLDACFWGVLFLQFGIIVTVAAHFLYDLTLFGLFAATGSGLAYRVSAVMIAFALLAPALAVVWRWVLQRKLTPAPDEARFGAWHPGERIAAGAPPERESTSVLGARARTVGMATAAAGVLVAMVAPRVPVLGPRFTVSRTAAAAVADSMMRAHAVDPSGWTRLTSTADLSNPAPGAQAADTLAAWPRFLVANDSEALAASLVTTYAIPAWWLVRYVHQRGPLSTRAEEWRVRVRPDGVPIDVRHIVPDSAPGAIPSPAEARRIARAALARAGLDTLSLRETKLEETARPARHDVTVTYTDSTVRLPGGAAARVWVSLAGTEPVLVRRGVDLPESFLREDRDRRMTRLLITALGGILLVSIGSVGAWFVIRRRQPLVKEEDVATSRPVLLAVIAGLSVLLIADSLNGLPSMLSQYDTAVTWSTFLTTQIVGVVAVSAFFILILAGLWLAANALRRRAGGGIPAFPRAGSPTASKDAVVAGVALGSLVAITQLVRAVTPSGVPPAPETSLDQMLPWMSGLISLPTFVLGMVPFVAIPPLVIAGLARRTPYRVLLALALLVMLAAISVPMGQRLPTPGTVVLSAAAAVALWFGIGSWGSLCVVVWLGAALANRALMALHHAIYAPTAPEHWGAALTVVASLALLWYLMRLSTRAVAHLESR